MLDKRHISKEKKVKYVAVERDTLNRLDRHPGCLRLYWTFQDANCLCECLPSLVTARSTHILFADYVLEYAAKGEILKAIKQVRSRSKTLQVPGLMMCSRAVWIVLNRLRPLLQRSDSVGGGAHARAGRYPSRLEARKVSPALLPPAPSVG